MLRRRLAHTTLVLSMQLALLLGSAPAVAHAQESDVAAAATPAYVPLTGVQAISAGGSHTCALTTSGGVKCWGRDQHGQVGDGANNDDKLTPVDVSGLANGVKAIAAGGAHTCALTTSGGVKCWGQDLDGQVGDGLNNDDKLTPVDVSGLTSGVQAIAAGGSHTCALTTDGGVKCWGRDSSGQVGDGLNNDDKLTPVNVSGLTSGVKAIAAGNSHTCALTVLGDVKCWGSDFDGQVGDGVNNAAKLTPVNVSGISGSIQAIAADGFHTCALTTGGGAKCWGRDEYGQVGDGANNDDKLTPVDVSGLTSGVKAIAAGGAHTCALTAGGGVKCWGGDSFGQVGDGSYSSDDQLTPVDVSGLSSGVQAIAAGGFHTCALTTDDGIKCWGWDYYSQIGDGPLAGDKDVPVDVIVPETCYQLSRAKNGSGALPVAAFAHSPGCPLDHYLPGTQIILQAAPSSNQRVQSWSAPVAGGPGDELTSLAMPPADTTVTVTYALCRTLSLSHSGTGSNPIASPPNSLGCVPGRYAAGESIVLNAVPGAGKRVKAWSGASATPAAGSQVNSLTMPNAAATVSVAYEACFALSTGISGSGDPLLAAPATSYGCLAGGFAAGQSITLVASPALGWVVEGWSGTSYDSSTAVSNSVVMPGGEHSVGVTYVQRQEAANLYLPAMRR